MIVSAFLATALAAISLAQEAVPPGHHQGPAILEDKEIAALIEGKGLESSGALWFIESFRTDGTWVIHMDGRGPYTRTGTWTVRNHMICVRTDEMGERCRHLLRLDSGALGIQNYQALKEPVIVRPVPLR